MKSKLISLIRCGGSTQLWRNAVFRASSPSSMQFSTVSPQSNLYEYPKFRNKHISIRNLSFEPLSLNTETRVVDFILSRFLRTEPVLASLRLDPDTMRERYQKLVRHAATQSPVSSVALNTQSGDVVGIRVATLINTKKTAALQTGYYDKTPTAGCVGALDMNQWIVVPGYKHKGLATKLIQLTEGKAREFGAEATVVAGVNQKSQKLYRKCGYLPVRGISYAAVVNPDTGAPFLQPKDGTTHCEILIKKF